MIHLKYIQWNDLADHIYSGSTRQITNIYAGDEHVYPASYYRERTPNICGMKIGETEYWTPLILHMPGATKNDDGFWTESISPTGHTTIATAKQQIIGTADKTWIYKGLYLIDEDVKLTAETYEQNFTKKMPEDTGYSFYHKTGDDETINETIKAVGETKRNIITPIVRRYLSAAAWIKDGYESLVPSWMQYYTPSTKWHVPYNKAYLDGLIYRAYPGLLAVEGFNLRPDIWAEGSYFPSTATPIRCTAIYDVVTYAQGYFVPFTGKSYGMTSAVEGMTAGSEAYLPLDSFLVPPDLCDGTWGGAGSLLRTAQSYPYVRYPTSVPSTLQTNDWTYGPFCNLYSGSTLVGGVAWTVDNIITGYTTQSDFLWYKGNNPDEE